MDGFSNDPVRNPGVLDDGALVWISQPCSLGFRSDGICHFLIRVMIDACRVPGGAQPLSGRSHGGAQSCNPKGWRKGFLSPAPTIQHEH